MAEIIKNLLNTEEAAKYLGDTKPTTLEQWRWNGKGPEYVKIGRNVRYRRSKLDEFIDRNSFTNTTESQQKAA